MEIRNLLNLKTVSMRDNSKQKNSTPLATQDFSAKQQPGCKNLQSYFAPMMAFKGNKNSAMDMMTIIETTPSKRHHHRTQLTPEKLMTIKQDKNLGYQKTILDMPVEEVARKTLSPVEVEVLEAERTRLDEMVTKTKEAQKVFDKLNQQEIDRVFESAALYAARYAKPLAKAAIEETKKGNESDKILKNIAATAGAVIRYKDMKTKGLIEKNDADRIGVVAEPVGVIAGVTPVTNPTSTGMIKTLMALKSGNGIVLSPHPSAKNCTTEAVNKVAEKAVETAKFYAKKKGLGDEEVNKLDNLISVYSMSGESVDKLKADDPKKIGKIGMQLTQDLMGNKGINLVLATGGGPLVMAANKSGNPSLGVGAGNTPIIIDASADKKLNEDDTKTVLESSVRDLAISKKFDNGLLCTGEQIVFAEDKVYDKTKKEFIKNGGLILEDKEDVEKLRNHIFQLSKTGKRSHGPNPDIIGQSAEQIAKGAGIKIPTAEEYSRQTGVKLPKDWKPEILIAEVDESGAKEAMSWEKLSPTMAIMKVNNFSEGMDRLSKQLDNAGKGHTAILVSTDDDHKNEFVKKAEASRLAINQGAAMAAVGLTSEMPVTLTLSCGPKAKNNIIGKITNVTPENLVNYKNIVDKSKPIVLDDLLKVPSYEEAKGGKRLVYNKTTDYFGPGAVNKLGEIAQKLKEEKDIRRVLVVTDGFLNSDKFQKDGKPVMKDIIVPQLEKAGMKVKVFDGVVPNPTTKNIDDATEAAKDFGAQAVIAVGGGSPIDTAKSVAVLMKAPGKTALDLYSRKVDPNKGAAPIVAVNTTAGTGSEFTQFAVGTIPGTGHKPAIFSRMLRPEFSVDDPDLMLNIPKKGTIYPAIDSVAHAFEAATTIGTVQTVDEKDPGKHTPNVPIYTVPFAETAIGLVAKNLPEINKGFNEKGFVDKGNEKSEARHNVLYGSMLAGMSFDDKGFLHLGHALEHPLSGLKEDLPHGEGLAILLPAVVEHTFKDKDAAKVGAKIMKPVFESVGADIKGDGSAEDARKAGVATEKWIFQMGATNKADIYENELKESVAKMENKPVENVGRKDVINKLVSLAEETPGLDNLLQCSPVEPEREVMEDIFNKALKPYDENKALFESAKK